MITSASNEKIKFARSLARKKDRLAARQFLLEGTRLNQEAVRAGAHPTHIFFERGAFQSDARLRALVVAWERAGDAVLEVSAPVMRALAETETPQGLAAVYALPELTPPSTPRLTLILDQVRDPGNLGTILRTAWAAGVESVLLAPGTADPFNPKVVRAGMGAHFHLPLLTADWSEIATRLNDVPRVYLSDARGDTDYTRADWSPPSALIVGGEA